jgi:hypothetical protein
MAFGLTSAIEKVERGRCADPCVWWFQLQYKKVERIACAVVKGKEVCGRENTELGKSSPRITAEDFRGWTFANGPAGK